IQLLLESQLLPNQQMYPIFGDHVANAILSQVILLDKMLKLMKIMRYLCQRPLFASKVFTLMKMGQFPRYESSTSLLQMHTYMNL
ncbi:hypothetical protein Dsin_032656, partial [Dipteronia sinensis]